MAEEHSYYVLAVQNAENEDERIIASPFVKGKAPWQYNLFHMGGSSESQWIDGVRYYIYECENLDIFANYGVYLGVSDQAPGAGNFSYNEKTGEISANPKYNGVSVLFELSLDRTKANEEKAQEAFKTAMAQEKKSEIQKNDTQDAKNMQDDQADRVQKIIKKWNDLPEQQRIKFAKTNGVRTKKETVHNENYVEKIGKEFIPGGSYTDQYLDVKIAVLVKKETVRITYYRISLDEAEKFLFS